MSAAPIAASETAQAAASAGLLTMLLDEAARRYPDDLALCDQPNRSAWSGREPRQRTWKAVQENAERLARFLAGLRLGAGARVGVCLPNCSEALLAVLATERAGLTPVLLPVASDPEVLAGVVERADVRAFIGQARMGDYRPANALTEVAAADFRVRFLLGFGPGLPDGMVDLDPVLDGAGESTDGVLAGPGASEAALVTFPPLSRPSRMVVRSSASLVAAAAPLAAAMGVKRGDRIASFVAADDLKGLAGGVVAALLSGATLELVEVASREALDGVAARPGRLHLVCPAWMEAALPLDAVPSGSLVLAQDGPMRSRQRPEGRARIVDVVSLDEIALLVLAGRPPRLPEKGSPFLETRVDERGLMWVRGMAAARPTPDGTPFAFEWVQTGFQAVLDGTVLSGLA